MKKILFITLIVFASFACSKDTGTIIGTASADGGNVLSGITVKLYDEDANMLTQTTTDNAGNFSFSGLEAGNYYIGATITVGSDVWDTGNRPQMVFVSGDIEKEVSLTLNKK